MRAFSKLQWDNPLTYPPEAAAANYSYLARVEFNREKKTKKTTLSRKASSVQDSHLAIKKVRTAKYWVEYKRLTCLTSGRPSVNDIPFLYYFNVNIALLASVSSCILGRPRNDPLQLVQEARQTNSTVKLFKRRKPSQVKKAIKYEHFPVYMLSSNWKLRRNQENITLFS